MNDWSNDSLKVGDLVEVSEYGYMRDEFPTKCGLVLECERPPIGSLFVFNVKVLVGGREVSWPRNALRKLE